MRLQLPTSQMKSVEIVKSTGHEDCRWNEQLYRQNIIKKC